MLIVKFQEKEKNVETEVLRKWGKTEFRSQKQRLRKARTGHFSLQEGDSSDTEAQKVLDLDMERQGRSRPWNTPTLDGIQDIFSFSASLFANKDVYASTTHTHTHIINHQH